MSYNSSSNCSDMEKSAAFSIFRFQPIANYVSQSLLVGNLPFEKRNSTLTPCKPEEFQPDVAAIRVAQENVLAVRVVSDVLAPARDAEIAPTAVARSCRRDHHGVVAVREQVGARHRVVRRRELARHGSDQLAGMWAAVSPPPLVVARPRRRAALAPGAAGRPPSRSARREARRMARRRARRDRRPPTCPGGAPCRRARLKGSAVRRGGCGVVDRLVEAVVAACAHVLEALEVGDRIVRREHRARARWHRARRCRSVAGSPACRPKPGTPKGQYW